MANQMNPFFVGAGGMQMGNHMMTGLSPGLSPGLSGMDPASNNQPLQFNTSKGKAPMVIPGEQLTLSKDVDLRQKADSRADISEASMSGIGGGGGGGMMGGWNPMMTPSMNHMGDMMMSYSQYGFMGTPLPMSSTDGASTMSGQKEIITLKSAILYPPPPNAPPPSLRERPPGCRTIFVGGLPETVTDDIIRDMFENCGSITSMRISKKNFAHVRFDFEESVDKSLYLSGYRIKIENKDDKVNTGRLHVDYAQARDDLYEWECKARTYAREERHRIRMEEERLRPPSPPPITHFSDHEAAVLIESLKNEEGFKKAAQILTTWLTRGDCNRRTSNTFYSLVQGVHSHVKRLQTDKQQHDEELDEIRMKFRLRMEGILRQFEQIEQVFAHASKQKVWDHFSKAQRKNLDAWRKQAQEIRHSQQEEYFNDRNEAEMEMSDSDMEDNAPVVKKQRKEPVAATPEAQAISAHDWVAMSQVRIENEDLKTQMEAYKNEVELLKQERQERSERQGEGDQGKQVRALQQALQGMQQQLMNAKQEIKRTEEEMHALRSLPDDEGGSNTAAKEDDQTQITSSVQPLTDKEARLIGLLSTFLHVHPTGASVDYIWSYLNRLDIPVKTRELEDVLEKFPHMFRQDLSGVGASLEKRWTFVGFQSA